MGAMATSIYCSKVIIISPLLPFILMLPTITTSSILNDTVFSDYKAIFYTYCKEPHWLIWIIDPILH